MQADIRRKKDTRDNLGQFLQSNTLTLWFEMVHIYIL